MPVLSFTSSLRRPSGDTSAQLPTAALVLLAVLVWACWPTIASLISIWSTNATYSHGFLVPVTAAALIWCRRRLPVRVEHGRPLAGQVLITLGIALRLAGARYYFEWLEWVSLLPLAAGICVLTGGVLAWRRAWPGIAFLAFMLPLPYRLEVALSGPLQSVATSASTWLLQTCGFPAFGEGNVIVVRDVRVGVAEACSGLRMLVSFFAVSTAVAMLVHSPLWERLFIIMSAVPIALVCNIARITGTAMAYETIGSEMAHRLFHDLAGWLMMPMAVCLLLAELWVLSRLLIPPPDREVVPIGKTRAADMPTRVSNNAVIRDAQVV